jgi:glyoxylase-like metal-dependent hydrolase (beta-lactamase superfamily II)
MVPVEGTVDVDVPASALWEAFTRADLWPRWNRCMFWVRNRDLVRDRRLLWAFRPIRWWYPYVLPAVARIVEVKDKKRVTWEVTALPAFYARHTYHMKDLGGGRTRFGSWEKAMGRGFRLARWFWVPHFVFVKDRSLEGARLLEEAYLREGKIDESSLPGGRRGKTTVLLLLPALAGATLLLWFYLSYVRQRVEELAPGVYAVFGGGGNSLVVRGGGEVLLVDPKFSLASRRLRGWIRRSLRMPVRKVVNTHYHYDHTQGNVLYPGARIIAHENVPDLMLSRDNNFNSSAYWRRNRRSLPDETLDGEESTETVGGREVVFSHPGAAHTSGDLVIRLPEHCIVATGDLFFNGHYPFLDRGEGGASIPGLIRALRYLADRYPEAVFLPGHGPLARADGVCRHANYLEFLQESVEQALREGLSEDEAVERIDLSGWDLSILPSLHGGTLTWATAENNVRWAYQLSKGQRES